MSKKKLVSILLSAVLCFGMLGSTFSASAAHVTVHLTKDQTVNSSANVHGRYKYFWGENSKSSAYGVYFIVRYKSSGVWITDQRVKLSPGQIVEKGNAFKTRTTKNETDWFLKLNPEGGNAKGCEAWGYMRNL